MGKIEIRDFDGDIEALSAMAHDSWFEEYGEDPWRDLFRPELVRHLFVGVPDPRFLVAAYDGAKLVGFIANLPRVYRFNGQTCKAVVSTMFVSRQGYQGAAVYLISECLRRNAEFGADFALMFFVKKHRPWPLFDKYLKPHYRIEVLKTMHAIVHSVDFDKITYSQNLKWYEVAGIKLLGAHRPITAPSVSGTVRPYSDADLVEILALTRRYSDQNCLVRVFDEESLARQLHTEDVTSTVVYERGGAVEGFINFGTHDLISNQGSYRWAWLDFLYWEGLSGKEKKALLTGLWEASRGQDCIGLLEWNKDYYVKGALFRSHFIPWLPFVEVNAWIFNPDLSLHGIDKIFDEVI
jgi:hypothetical protein